MKNSVNIITIGDELMIGQVVDTNSAWMADKLKNAMFAVNEIFSIHDDGSQIKDAIVSAQQSADIVLITGGLGPTKDDITKHTLCELFDTHLIHSQAVEDNIKRLWANRNRQVLNPLTATQAMVPANCEVLQNDVGTAPIMLWKRNEGERKIVIVSMPGVPYEMQYAMENYVIPRLKVEYPNPAVSLHQTYVVEGIAESALAIHLEQWEAALPDYMHLAYLPKAGMIRLRLDAVSSTKSEGVLNAEMQEQLATLRSLINDYMVASDDEPLEVSLGRLLRERSETIATAESCTGGSLASLLAKHAGSSDFYLGSVVSYANDVKHNVLGVSEADLDQYGAVSEPVVRQMAEGARRVIGSDWAIATSGIAGPGGGTVEKPVGTIWVAVSGPKGTIAHCLHLGTLREQNILRTCQSALALAIRLLVND